MRTFAQDAAFYNNKRRHRSLGVKTPADYARVQAMAADPKRPEGQ